MRPTIANDSFGAILSHALSGMEVSARRTGCCRNMIITPSGPALKLNWVLVNYIIPGFLGIVVVECITSSVRLISNMEYLLWSLQKSHSNGSRCTPTFNPECVPPAAAIPISSVEHRRCIRPHKQLHTSSAPVNTRCKLSSHAPAAAQKPTPSSSAPRDLLPSTSPDTSRWLSGTLPVHRCNQEHEYYSISKSVQ